LIQTGARASAETHFRKAVEIEPGDPRWLTHLAEHLAQHGKIQEAIELQREVIRLDPQNAAGHNNLAISLFRQEQFDEAVIHFVHAIRLDPQYQTAIVNFGKALARKGHINGLLDRHDPATLNRSHATSLVWAGNFFRRKGNIKEAEAAFQLALLIRPDFEPARRGLEKLER
jgi:tetratricopeptide (TPR) repeat protein